MGDGVAWAFRVQKEASLRPLPRTSVECLHNHLGSWSLAIYMYTAERLYLLLQNMAVYRKPPENYSPVHMFLVTLLPVLVVSRWIRFFYRIPTWLSPKAAFFTEMVDVGADGSLRLCIRLCIRRQSWKNAVACHIVCKRARHANNFQAYPFT